MLASRLSGQMKTISAAGAKNYQVSFDLLEFVCKPHCFFKLAVRDAFVTFGLTLLFLCNIVCKRGTVDLNIRQFGSSF